jgi:hypothetical protein
MRTTKALLAALLCLAGVANANTNASADKKPDASETYLGTLGKSAVVLRLYRNDDGRSVGTYFYRSQGVDIGLVAQAKEGQYIECPLRGGNDEPAPCDKPTGYWTLAVNGDTVTGTWRKTPQAASALPIVLKRTAASCDADFDPTVQARAYACLRADGPTHPTGKTGASHDGALAWQFVEEKRSGASMPQLTRAPDSTAMASINDALARRLRADIDNSLEAKPEGEGSCSHTIALANRRWFVVERSCEWDWPGAAHPSSSWDSTTFDVASGKAVAWPALVRLPDAKSRTFDYSKGHDIVSLALRHAAAQRDGNNDDDCMQQALEDFECKGDVCANKEYGDTSDSRGWEITLSPHEDGLFASFNVYPEVARNCRGEGVTLPWAEVRPLLLAPRTLP